jgi:2-succinyl-5-enolpyruvyl-6-hydroxy-3-cyclohexene-1-carboxylate synthase
VLDHLRDWTSGEASFTTYRVPTRAVGADEVARLAGVERGLVVVGKTDDAALGPAAVRLGAALGWPILPDVGSGIRTGAPPGVAAHYDAALASRRLAALRPEAVVHLGGPVVSKRLSTWIANARPRTRIVVRADPSRFDPAHAVTERIQADPAAWAMSVAGEASARPSSNWMQTWLTASDAAGAAIDELLDDALSEPTTARTTAGAVPAGGALVLGSSMPIRDVDTFARAEGPALRIAANRGASGIDGTVSTAAGFAYGTGVPTALLLGDLALMHDLNGLGLLRRPGMPPLVVVVINNDGGGIFSFLPIAEQAGVPFEELFGTPHGLEFGHAAEMYGLGYERPRTSGELAARIGDAFESGRPALLEVRTDRAANRALHVELLGRIGAAVDGVVAPRS